ncbi:Cyclin-like F-box [Cordyceps militaris CM01]|uniref:Cyclin-like F-box n=1 Tax=Cordyceps militaris (strain CM01) TaxID=983644 RepID=G3JC88_CORMM|nr:Cyclin-like F-box [Cordyceps militaris CM01]EGX93753.1 Cyclin-like F-box [Cordyceps militaris CM01]
MPASLSLSLQHARFPPAHTHSTLTSGPSQTTMDTLPVELFSEILSYLPPASRASARLTSRPFNAVLARSTFARLRAFLDDPDAAQAALRHTLHDLPRRPRALWSPNCSVPEGLPLPRSFLRAVCAALGGAPPLLLLDASDESGSDESEMEMPLEEDEGGVAAMLQRLRRPDIDHYRLRQALFRYALYKSYVYDGEGEAPQLWVMNSAKWKYQL